MTRPTWHQARLSMARELAKRSLCTRDQVGAVITDTNNRIIGEGYNGPPTSFAHQQHPCTKWCPRSCMMKWRETAPTADLPEPALSFEHRHSIPLADYSDCPSLHAEANALLMTDRSLRLAGTIYITSFPCVGCLKLISNAGLKTMVIGVDGDHEYRYRESDYETVRRLGMRIYFEDSRDFDCIITVAPGWVAPSQHAGFYG